MARVLRFTIAAIGLLVLLLALTVEVVLAASPGGRWSHTGSMNVPRVFHTATLLSNGMVLVAGGQDNTSNPVASAELYNPGTRTWSLTGSMNDVRFGPVATLLGNGKVLVMGGFNGSMQLASAELYDPGTGTWNLTGSMSESQRSGHTATLLGNGKVLVAGGGSMNTPGSAELYDPGTGTWSLTGSLNAARFAHIATLLGNGKVLVAGGEGPPCISGCTPLSSAELYDPTTGIWSLTGSMSTVRVLPTAKYWSPGVSPASVLPTL